MNNTTIKRALFLDDDPAFVVSAQKLLPRDTEWLATKELSKAEELVDLMAFDVIIVRKRNESILHDLIQNHIYSKANHLFKKLIILPRILWRRKLKGVCGEIR